jgi:hypothetical protein
MEVPNFQQDMLWDTLIAKAVHWNCGADQVFASQVTMDIQSPAPDIPKYIYASFACKHVQ